MANSPFVTCKNGFFYLEGRKYYVAGTNHHYLHYASPVEISNVLDDAMVMNLKVIRIFGCIDVGSLDGPGYLEGVSRKCTWSPWGKTAYDGETGGVFFQYWDTEKERPGYNDGPTGLERLDYALAEAKKRELKVIIVLTNNWKHYGGIDQYAEWYGVGHNEFFTDLRCREAYKRWAAHLINRFNRYTGIKYRDDPTIFSWELTNEAHVDGAPTAVIVDWTREMSAFIKELDPNHMVALGDEGFFSRPFSPQAADWKYNGCTGLDYREIINIPTIDYGSFHLYPDYWEENWRWGSEVWLPEHVEIAREAGKPCLLGEFGLKDKENKNQAYQDWTDTIERLEAGGFLFWRLIGKQADGTYPVDQEGFDVHYPSETATILAKAASRLWKKGRWQKAATGCDVHALDPEGES